MHKAIAVTRLLFVQLLGNYLDWSTLSFSEMAF